MTRTQAIRALGAAVAGSAGIALAVLVGAPPIAAFVAFFGGMVAFVLGRRATRDARPSAPTEQAADEPALPGIAELLRAFDEPLLIVRDRKVLATNAAARGLLGAHIEGVDVRLAIRHPAAAELLTGTGDDGRRIELVGIGDAGRPWMMSVTNLPDGSRLVRLADQSQARGAEQMRVDFVANASHELRTPLATLLGFIETLEDDEAGGDAGTRARFLKIMFDEATRMRSLVDDLISLSRIEAERFALPRDPIPLLPLIDEVKAALAQLMEQRQSSLIIDNADGAAIVQGDRPQLAQLLNNLIANAVKYGRAGAPVRIRIDNAPGDMLRFTIIDEGEGIASEHIPRLTERFYRVDTGRSRAAGGTGLGLAIVKHIVLRHRGRMDIRSVQGVGTQVEICLPRASVTEESPN